ncbi:MAG: zinc metalloprotease HtpX [Candidatus Pacebacteria bacterium]|jgi:heat shock protein HtpX|nr:zinc metalloprotease HtpX [Candidatus Paceibacterota bacterium]MDD5535344.1 zinc metalloprotease HtpX [Candidatus Paceibacterota bacterium]
MTLYTQAESNIRKTWFLITAFLVLVILLGWSLSYIFESPIILYIAVVISVVMSFSSYWHSDKIILSMTNSKPIKKQDHPELYRIVENLSITAGLPMPKVYIINDPSPNAFATGRDPKHGVVCVTQGLLNKLEKSELEGVIAHELSHIGNRDILLGSVIVVLVGLIALLSDLAIRSLFFSRGRRDDKGSLGMIMLFIGIIAAILAPLAASLLRLAISRKREFLADASGALLTRYPEGLARALEKISQDPISLKAASNATNHLFIASPLKGKKVSKLWMTHPPIEERVKALRQMDI